MEFAEGILKSVSCAIIAIGQFIQMQICGIIHRVEHIGDMTQRGESRIRLGVLTPIYILGIRDLFAYPDDICGIVNRRDNNFRLFLFAASKEKRS